MITTNLGLDVFIVLGIVMLVGVVGGLIRRSYRDRQIKRRLDRWIRDLPIEDPAYIEYCRGVK